MTAYYNEHDPKAAAWLRELIKQRLITDGEVDERSIEDVIPADVGGFNRVHFFAGIGVWDYALNLAGWGERPVWTGSCPCQPFSTAGKGKGFADERHLWPAWFHLIEVCRPDTLFGEQTASKDGLTWLDLVSSDLEGIDYTTAAIDFPVAGVGAPHIRQRLYFVADTQRPECQLAGGTRSRRQGLANNGTIGRLANATSDRRDGKGTTGETETGREPRSEFSGKLSGGLKRRGFTNGFWDGPEWVYCNDPDIARWRPIKPGTFPLAARTPDRMAYLRGVGNAISPWQAKAFIESYLEILG